MTAVSNKAIVSMQWLAAFVFVAGILIFKGNLSAEPAVLARIEKKKGNLHTLRALADQADEQTRLIGLLERYAPVDRPTLSALVKKHFRSGGVLVLRETFPVADKWMLKRYDLTVDGEFLRQLGSFIVATHHVAPPYRISECSIDVGRGQPGRGRITVIVEELEFQK